MEVVSSLYQLGDNDEFHPVVYDLPDEKPLCRWCGDEIGEAEDILQAGRCKPCYARWQEENRFKDLCSLFLDSPDERALPQATTALMILASALKLR